MEGSSVEEGQSVAIDSDPKQKSFRNFLEGFKTRWSKKTSVPVAQHDVASVVLPEGDKKVDGIANLINEEIKKKELKPPEFKSEGASSFSSTNERINPEILHEIQNSENAPDGYLVGVGVSNIFSLLDTFPEGKIPKGIVLINIDPKATKQAEDFVDYLKQGKLVSFAGGSPSTYYDSKSAFARKDNDSQKSYEEQAYHEGEKQVDTSAVILRHKELLFKLAKEGNIAVLQQNILDQNLIEILDRLPGFQTSNNVIYLSNIADWIYRNPATQLFGERLKAHSSGLPLPPDLDIGELFRPFGNLQKLETDLSHKNFC